MTITASVPGSAACRTTAGRPTPKTGRRWPPPRRRRSRHGRGGGLRPVGDRPAPGGGGGPGSQPEGKGGGCYGGYGGGGGGGAAHGLHRKCPGGADGGERGAPALLPRWPGEEPARHEDLRHVSRP